MHLPPYTFKKTLPLRRIYITSPLRLLIISHLSSAGAFKFIVLSHYRPLVYIIF